MKTYFTLFILILLFSSCTNEKRGITNKMKVGLISFNQKVIHPDQVLNKENEIILIKNDTGFLTFTYISEEIGCPSFEGGYKISNKTLTLYYQDINHQLVKCIDFYELEYNIENENLDFEKVEIIRLKPIKIGRY